MCPLDERTLFCVGKKRLSNRLACYMVDMAEGKVRLLSRLNDTWIDRIPRLPWRDGKRLLAWSGGGLCEGLLERDFKFVRVPVALPYGWNFHDDYLSGIVAMAEIDGRRFVTAGGLHEFDHSGKIIRSWWRSAACQGDINLSLRLCLPPDCPLQTDMMACTGTLLVFAAGGSLTAWDPRTNTWYGPLASGGAMYVHGTRAGHGRPRPAGWNSSPTRRSSPPRAPGG